MAVKQVWVMAPNKFTTKTGKTVLVGMTTGYDTGKIYKGTGARERQRAEKRKKLNGRADAEQLQADETDQGSSDPSSG